MKLNPDKLDLLIFGGGGNTDVSVHIGGTMVTESVEEKLGVTLDKNLDFKMDRGCMHLHVLQVT